VPGRAAGQLRPPAGLIVVARLVAASLGYLAVFNTGWLLLYVVGSTLVPDADRGTFGLIALGVAEAATIGLVLLLWRFVDGQPLVALGLEPAPAGRQWLRGAGVAALMMGFIVLVWYTLVDGATWDTNTDAVRAAVVVVGGLVGFAIQGPAEEILFRGYILENVRAEWGPRWAVAVSALGFALLHAQNPAFNPVALVNLVLFGVATALYKVRVDRGQLWGVFAIHTVWNWLQQVVFGLPNSGIASTPQDALFTVTPNQSLPDPIWGGGFGPEGTVAAGLVLLALISASVRQPARVEALRSSRRPGTGRG
jgi:membrane protease YdiL (CAAX protease family)